MAAYRAGHVTLANAIGTGIADDKSIYPYVPDMIRFYLGEEPLLANVPTRILRRKDDLAYVLAHLDELVVKEVHGSGGYGMLVGPTASRGRARGLPRCASSPRRRSTSRSRRWRSRPARPSSSRASRRGTSTCGRSCSRAATSRIVPGGLTRVALRDGSLVVNSSQGGGTKDTWVLEDVMLSRTADHVYWLGRYAERAENLARTLDVQYRLSLLPHDGRVRAARAGQQVLRTLGLEDAYAERHDGIEPHWVIDFLAFDTGNPVEHPELPARRARERPRRARLDLLGDVGDVQRRPGSRRARRRRAASRRSTSPSSSTG